MCPFLRQALQQQQRAHFRPSPTPPPLPRTRGRAGEGGQQAVGQVHCLGRQRCIATQVGCRRQAAQDADHRLEEADGGAALKVELVQHPAAASAGGTGQHGSMRAAGVWKGWETAASAKGPTPFCTHPGRHCVPAPSSLAPRPLRSLLELLLQPHDFQGGQRVHHADAHALDARAALQPQKHVLEGWRRHRRNGCLAKVSCADVAYSSGCSMLRAAPMCTGQPTASSVARLIPAHPP